MLLHCDGVAELEVCGVYSQLLRKDRRDYFVLIKK